MIQVRYYPDLRKYYPNAGPPWDGYIISVDIRIGGQCGGVRWLELVWKWDEDCDLYATISMLYYRMRTDPSFQ